MGVDLCDFESFKGWYKVVAEDKVFETPEVSIRGVLIITTSESPGDEGGGDILSPVNSELGSQLH